MRRFVNHYEVLGVDRDAESGEIKKAYRRLAGRFHPDKVCTLGSEERESAAEEMRKINNAKMTLLDDAERMRFDHLLGIMDRKNIPTSTEFSDVEVTLVTDEMDDVEGMGVRGGGGELIISEVTELDGDEAEAAGAVRSRRLDEEPVIVVEELKEDSRSTMRKVSDQLARSRKRPKRWLKVRVTERPPDDDF